MLSVVSYYNYLLCLNQYRFTFDIRMRRMTIVPFRFKTVVKCFLIRTNDSQLKKLHKCHIPCSIFFFSIVIRYLKRFTLLLCVCNSYISRTKTQIWVWWNVNILEPLENRIVTENGNSNEKYSILNLIRVGDYNCNLEGEGKKTDISIFRRCGISGAY